MFFNKIKGLSRRNYETVELRFFHSGKITSYLFVSFLSFDSFSYTRTDNQSKMLVNTIRSTDINKKSSSWISAFLSIYEYFLVLIPNLTRSATKHNWADLPQSWLYEAIWLIIVLSLINKHEILLSRRRFQFEWKNLLRLRVKQRVSATKKFNVTRSFLLSGGFWLER